ncbi:hypothetical protein QBC41DRAFT_102677 [Cercophora samala]|uniref:Transmembrane protein n=1 Tax=Cercophora samala TaxID=330535 RepID=A0AA39ZMH9_9PEZI|nr:hypothetical protein QBC41DRAFT_102677 [Cercophora samala]
MGMDWEFWFLGGVQGGSLGTGVMGILFLMAFLFISVWTFLQFLLVFYFFGIVGRFVLTNGAARHKHLEALMGWDRGKGGSQHGCVERYSRRMTHLYTFYHEGVFLMGCPATRL